MPANKSAHFYINNGKSIYICLKMCTSEVKHSKLNSLTYLRNYLVTTLNLTQLIKAFRI